MCAVYLCERLPAKVPALLSGCRWPLHVYVDSRLQTLSCTKQPALAPMLINNHATMLKVEKERKR